jgi:2'-5' RNA ligase
MPGIITVLDPPIADRIERLWDEMEREFGVPRGYPGALPHFSYHLAESYHLERAAGVVRDLAAATPEFTVETSGFGVFTGLEPVFYIPVARGPALAALHASICERMRGAGMETNPYYLPERALPHITVAQQNIPAGAVAPLLEWLARQDFSWEVPVTNLALANQTPDSAVIYERFPLTAP